jgi:xanthine dehydrogenase YagS FAD-binding subunit
MSKDMMPGFELYQPDSVDGAVELLGRAGDGGWAMAGGHDSLDWFKDRVKRPEVVVDLGGIDELRGIRETADGGIEIGAMTTLTQVESNAIIRERFTVLSDAARRVASPQIRNTGTIGGNISQDTRCWYYRYGVDCYRAGGNTCYADTPEGQNREHCLWGADRCVAVTPSDTAPAMVVLDARMVIRGADGEREVAAEDYFIGPDIDIERMTVLEPGEVLTSIRIPGDWAGATFYFEKVADRNTWDFPLVNIAAAMFVSGGNIERIRMAAGAVECVPRRLTVVEQIATGQPKNEATATLAGQSAVRGATPLNFNHFKIPLLQNLVTRAIRDA